MATQYGTPEEAKAMLEKAVAAVKENKAKAIDMFNKGRGEGGIRTHGLSRMFVLRKAARESMEVRSRKRRSKPSPRRAGH